MASPTVLSPRCLLILAVGERVLEIWKCPCMWHFWNLFSHKEGDWEIFPGP